MPAADFCRTVRVNRSTLSHDSVTCNRSPEVSSIAFHAQPPDLPPVPLMDVGFAIRCSLARQRRPPIQFLSIGSRVCYTLLSDLASRLSPCALLSLRLHQAAERTCTSKLSSMLGTQQKARKLAHRELPGPNSPPNRYFTFKNTIANVYSAMDSISTSAKINAKRIAAAAPGLRANPSQAAAVALACA